jgi:hypothetical protein
VDGEAALLWQQHGLHRLHHLLRDGQLVEGQGLPGDRASVRC